MFQPGGRGGDLTIDGGFAPAWETAAPRFAPHVERALDRLAVVDFAVDLGDSIGSRTWWRGVATLLCLCIAMALGGAPSRLIAPVAAPLTVAQADDANPDTLRPLALGATSGRITAPTRFARPLAEAPERPRIELTARYRATDSFEGALRRAGIGAADANAAARLVGAEIRLDQVRAATDLDLVLGRRETKRMPRPLEALGFRAAFDLRLELARVDGALALKRLPIAIDDTPLRITGTVGGSLARSAKAAGLSAPLVAEAIRQFGYAVDFQHGVGRRDRFDLVVEHRRAATGETQTGGLMYAALGKTELMRWTYAGKPQFFRASGESARKGLMKTPVDGARLTSGFGMRFHPLLNYSRLHQGVDFGAASGSPIIAAAAGRVSFAGYHGGHGNYVRLAHNKGLATAYAHLSRFAVKNGQAVSQGQVIGYVGSTGLSTGPHLHYEVWLNARPVNPMTIKFLGGTQLGGADLVRFQGEMSRLRMLRGAGSVVAYAAPTAAKAQRG